ncbi:MAG: translation initiation factor IF-3 [SAR324 cluster bacterium]|nr:translation initiation factor IF-3 [SAR324 cluster bacterium]
MAVKGKDDLTRINDQIKVPEVRLIDAEGNQLGVLSISDALQKAEIDGLDLVEVSPNAEPPVCRLMDYGKFKYQLSKKQHAAKKHQKVVHIKELKLRPKTEEHDLLYKVRNAIKFLEDGDKVKVNVVFMGRELTHKEIGELLLHRFIDLIGTAGIVEQSVRSEGRNMTIILSPKK